MTQDKLMTDEQRNLFEKVAEVCGLELPTPGRYQTDDSPSPDILDELEASGMEALGICDRLTGDVTLYVRRCAQAAKEFQASSRDVELIVLAHEWAHKIQHQGKHPDAPVPWEDFPRLYQYSGTNKEDLAQKAAFMALHKLTGGKDLQGLMRRLAEAQPREYREWLKDCADWLESGNPPVENLAWLQGVMRLVRSADKETLFKVLGNNYDQ